MTGYPYQNTNLPSASACLPLRMSKKRFMCFLCCDISKHISKTEATPRDIILKKVFPTGTPNTKLPGTSTRLDHVDTKGGPGTRRKKDM